MDNPFSWGYLTAPIDRTPTFGPFSIFYLALFSITFVVCLFLVRDARKRFADDKLKRDLIVRAGDWLLWVTGIGLFFFLIRSLRFEFLTFQLRIWMYLSFLAYVAVVGYFAWYVITQLPPQLAEVERRREMRKFHVSNQASAGKSKARRQAQRRRQRAGR